MYNYESVLNGIEDDIKDILFSYIKTESYTSTEKEREAENFLRLFLTILIGFIIFLTCTRFFYTLNKSCTQMKHFFISVICISSTFQTEI